MITIVFVPKKTIVFESQNYSLFLSLGQAADLSLIVRQANAGHVQEFMKSYEEATKCAHGYLMLDLKPTTDDHHRLNWISILNLALFSSALPVALLVVHLPPPQPLLFCFGPHVALLIVNLSPSQPFLLWSAQHLDSLCSLFSCLWRLSKYSYFRQTCSCFIRSADRISICSCFIHQSNLKITIEANEKVVNFLDVTLDLNTSKFKPYAKPTSTPLYVHKDPTTLRS